jgi:hypothetical protein
VSAVSGVADYSGLKLVGSASSIVTLSYSIVSSGTTISATTSVQLLAGAAVATSLSWTVTDVKTRVAPSYSPLIELFDASGALVASNDNGAADGRNAALNYAVPLDAGGTYRIRVGVTAGAGDYTLQVQGATGTLATPPGVVATSVSDGSTLTSFPGSITLNFSQPLALDTLSPGDLTINGAPATAVTVLGATQVRFDIDGLQSGDGAYQVALAAGALSDLAGEASLAFSQTFTLDTTGPSVVAITPAATGLGNERGGIDLDIDPEIDLAFADGIA